MTIWDEVHAQIEAELLEARRRDDIVASRLSELEPKIMNEFTPTGSRSWAEVMFVFQDQVRAAPNPDSPWPCK